MSIEISDARFPRILRDSIDIIFLPRHRSAEAKRLRTYVVRQARNTASLVSYAHVPS